MFDNSGNRLFGQEAVEDFAADVLSILMSALPVNADDIKHTIDTIEGKPIYVFAFVAPLIHGTGSMSRDDASELKHSDLYELHIEYTLISDRHGKFLTVRNSKYEIRVHTSPAIRFEYERTKDNVPAAHVHFSGVGGLLSPALMKNSRSGRKDPKRGGNVSVLHIPVGGHRFRPSLEDFLYFVVNECGFRSHHGWEKSLKESREQWFDIQLQAAIRDNPAVAAQAMRELGFSITEPEGGCPPKRRHESW